ncbi:hypothetical protein [uncultured Martelella sp.]|uniref:DUF7694 domain-containing protein n=1 Tax=uncultured Martelella sp. TaxID=392331 RepID=UPI0029C81C95|nr:hypothetical protein [uncultured Martelella sp.]
MRNLNDPSLFLYALQLGEDGGAFEIPHRPTSVVLRVVASVGLGWDHVSVSLPKRCPNWPEMEYVKRLFFREDETAMQLHVPPADHISHHPFCLHMWRPHHIEIPMPPSFMVA